MFSHPPVPLFYEMNGRQNKNIFLDILRNQLPIESQMEALWTMESIKLVSGSILAAF